MAHFTGPDVNLSVVGKGILSNTVSTFELAGRGDVPTDNGRTVVSSKAEQAAWAEIDQGIQARLLCNTGGVWVAARLALERALQNPDGFATHRGAAAETAARGDGQSTNLLGRDDGEDRQKPTRSNTVGL